MMFFLTVDFENLKYTLLSHYITNLVLNQSVFVVANINIKYELI